ncbi:MAG: M28 family metallopeptidase [Flavobacteriaceae bacterium]
MKQLLFLLVLFPLLLTAQNTINSTSFAETITAKELQENLYVYASDYFQGRETGTIGQKRAIDFLQNFYETHQISPAKGSDHYRQIMNLEIKGEKVATENIVAFLEGSEFPNEYLVISSHLDHIGVKEGEINNGADDDGSGTVALLEIAEAFKAASEAGYRPKRSLIFLHVTGEEKGLLGSKYYTDNPLYPLEDTVANLNIDMIGRTDPTREDKDPNYIYLIGADRLSQELHDISEATNKKYARLKLDYTFNEENDPNRFYFRSDHYNFAKNNIPVIFYFSGTHEDYHRPGDTPDKIRYDLLEKRTRLIFHTAWELANRPNRIALNTK